MNVFILDRSMEKSAQMLDDAHLKAQINEACQILMANYNHERYPDAKIGHVNNPVTVFYSNDNLMCELLNYTEELINEYEIRFKKTHQNYFFVEGFYAEYVREKCGYDIFLDNFIHSKTYVNGNMTDDIDAIRKYIMTKPHTRPLTWTNREKPDWWEG